MPYYEMAPFHKCIEWAPQGEMLLLLMVLDEPFGANFATYIFIRQAFYV
jgi:hypothetical protein